MSKRVLCVITDGFEEIEAITPVDLLRRAEVEVVIASLDGGLVKGRCGVVIQPDATLEEVNPENFDLLFLPGGPGVKALRSDGRAASLARKFYDSGRPVAAICAAPLVLNDAGLLEGHRFTSHSSTWSDLPKAEDERVIEDGLLLTSRGAGTALDFGFALVRLLAGPEVVDEVSESIMS
jgi:DJ-1 family protein